MSGLSSLVLSPTEIASIDQQYKRTVQNLLKLSVNSPPSLVHFVAGSLPLTAILHLRQLSLFSMICRLPADPLNSHGRHILLTSTPASYSWFVRARNIMLQYQLPHPLELLSNPPTKEAFKKLAKAKVTDYWETKLRLAVAPLLERSLCYFHPEYMSLKHPHKLLLAAGKKAYEVSKAIIQLKFLSSQYPCGERTRHWTPSNPRGLCTFPSCFSEGVVETQEHVLLHCCAYSPARNNLLGLCMKIDDPVSHSLVANFILCGPTKMKMLLLLDCSAIPEVITASQKYGDYVFRDIFYVGRTWCFSIHRERMKRLGLWNFA